MGFRGGRRRSKRSRKGRKRGGSGFMSLLNQAAVPGLLGTILLASRKHRHKSHKRHGTRKGMVRKTARRAFMHRV